jgi:Polyketide cyclase / dehydrase and lipid transport
VSSSHTNTATVEIDAPPDAVFPWLADSGRRCEWMSALVESEPLTDGPLQVGSRFRDVFEDYGKRVELEAELVHVDPPWCQTVRLEAKSFEATSSQRLEAVDGGTRLTAVIETRYTSRAARLLASVVTRHAQARLESDLARLKRLIESA